MGTVWGLVIAPVRGLMIIAGVLIAITA